MGIGDHLALLLAVVFWASSFAAIRFAVADLGAGHLTLLRFLVASLVMAVYLVASRAKVPPMRDLAALGGLGFLGISIYHFGLNWGETQVESGTASLLVATETGWMAVFAWFYLRERPTTRIWAGVVLSMVAAGLIVYGQGQRLGGRMAHCLAVLAAAVSVSLFSVLQRRLVAQYGALQFSAWTVLGGTVPFLIFWPGLAETVRHATWAALASVVYLAIFPGLVGYVVWARTVTPHSDLAGGQLFISFAANCARNRLGLVGRNARNLERGRGLGGAGWNGAGEPEAGTGTDRQRSLSRPGRYLTS